MSATWRGLPSRATIEQYRGRIAILFVLIVAIWFLLAFAEQAWRARELQAEVEQQRAAIAAIDADNRAHQQQLDTNGTDAWLDYVQARARRDLNLANPGETVLMVRWGPRPAGNEQQAPPVEASDPPNWRRWLDVFVDGG